LNTRDLKIRANRDPWSRFVELAVIFDQGKKTFSAKRLEIVEHDPSMVVEPFISIYPGAAQLLMDDLWQAGIRPSEGTGSAGALAATQDHLKDIRRLLFHKEGIQ
jgi:hypothetical protein